MRHQNLMIVYLSLVNNPFSGVNANGLLTHAAPWMNLADNAVSERNQKHKNTDCVIIWELVRDKTNWWRSTSAELFPWEVGRGRWVRSQQGGHLETKKSPPCLDLGGHYRGDVYKNALNRVLEVNTLHTLDCVHATPQHRVRQKQTSDPSFS